MGAQLRRARDDHELLQQLRSVAARREVHPAPDHQRPPRPQTAALRRGRQCARLDPRRRPQLRGAERSSSEVGSARPTWSARTASAPTSTSSGSAPAHLDAPRTTSRWSPTVPGTTSATRSSRASSGCELGWRPEYDDFDAGLASTIEWYRAHEDWWRPHKDATEAAYAAKGSSRARGSSRPRSRVSLVVRPRRARGRPRVVQGELAARADGGRWGSPDFTPVQDNIAYNSRRGTTRGLHAEPWDKLVSVPYGRGFGAWVDLRAGDGFGATSRRARTRDSPCSCRVESATATRHSTTAPPTPTWSTTTGRPTLPTPRLTWPTRRSHRVADPVGSATSPTRTATTRRSRR